MDITNEIELSIKHSHQKVLLPLARKFEDIFERAEVIPDLSKRSASKVESFSKEWKVDVLRLGKPAVLPGAGIARLETFCSVRDVMGGKSWYLDVFPKPEVIKLVEKQMMLCDGYRINFEIIIRDGGVALVAAHYNYISGSRWFGYVDGASIPGKPE